MKRVQDDEGDRKGKKIKEDDDDSNESSSSDDVEDNDSNESRSSEESSSSEDEEDEASNEDTESTDYDSEGNERPPRVRGNLPAYLFLDSARGERWSKDPIYIFKKTKLLRIEMGCQAYPSRLLTGVKRYIEEKLGKKSKVPKPFSFQFQKKNSRWAGVDELITMHEEIFDRECTFIELSKAHRIGVFPMDQQLVFPQPAFPRIVPVKLLSNWNFLEFTLEETIQVNNISTTSFTEFEEDVERLRLSLIYSDSEEIEPKYRMADGIQRRYLPIPTTFEEFVYLLGDIVLHKSDEVKLDDCKMTLGQMFELLHKQRAIPFIPAKFLHCE